ncbi:hypothetical protein [uncultured Brachyspira sp.]|uniref:hypothetical protein n=1 Tax=uncultured Brachyspira sp. TaxID=221953 RepID=UPI00261F26AF|nr:hypothetical protein [uncultured Brachyspira sp.]
MIDFQDKFDDLQDLSISEEMLGAYVEGNLRGSEFREVSNLLSIDDDLSDLVQSVESDGINLDSESIGSLDLPDFASMAAIHNLNNISQIESLQTEQINSPWEQSVDDIICIANDYLSGMMHIQDDNDDCHGRKDNELNFNDSNDEELGIIDDLNI